MVPGTASQACLATVAYLLSLELFLSLFMERTFLNLLFHASSLFLLLQLQALFSHDFSSVTLLHPASSSLGHPL